jgi:ankyrin repeat protein
MTIFFSLCITGVLVGLYYYSRNSARVTLRKAIEQMSVAEVERLVSNGVDVTVQLSNGARPVVYASLFGVPRLVEVLINAGADVSDGLALHSAAINGDLETLELLIRSGASVDGVDVEHGNKSALHVAAEFAQQEVITYLVAQGADQALCDSQGRTWREVVSGNL